jgi:hypothetical protein
MTLYSAVYFCGLSATFVFVYRNEANESHHWKAALNKKGSLLHQCFQVLGRENKGRGAGFSLLSLSYYLEEKN